MVGGQHRADEVTRAERVGWTRMKINRRRRRTSCRVKTCVCADASPLDQISLILIDGATGGCDGTSLTKLLRDITIQQRQETLTEFDRPFLSVLRPFAGGKKRCDDTNQGAIGAIHAESIDHQPKLSPVLVGNGAIMRLVPIKNQQTLCAPGNNIAVRGDGRSAGPLQPDPAGLDGGPTRTWKAVFRRMDGIAAALAGEVS